MANETTDPTRGSGEMENSGPWTCFHCGETFTKVGEARDHFGATEGAEAGCLIDRVALETGTITERGRGLLMALRKAESEIESLRRSNEQLDHEAGAYHSMMCDFKRRWPQHNGSAIMAYDYMEGRALAAEEQLTARQQTHDALLCPGHHARYLETVDRPQASADATT